jgi:hypothetical protein
MVFKYLTKVEGNLQSIIDKFEPSFYNSLT